MAKNRSITSAVGSCRKAARGGAGGAERPRAMVALISATLAVGSWAQAEEAALSGTAMQQAACVDGAPQIDTCPDARVIVRSAIGTTEYRVRSVRAQRDAGVVKQRYDYSCGSASLATLLTYGLNDPTDERELLGALLERQSPAQLTTLLKNGLSLYDLQQLAQQRGHKAEGFRLHQSQLAGLSRPVIVFIKPRGYAHFAVLKGVRGDRVHLADPSLGNVRMPLYRFLEMWSDDSGRGVIFAVEQAEGNWPDRYALQLAGGTDTPLEVLSAEHLMEIGKPFLSKFPYR